MRYKAVKRALGAPKGHMKHIQGPYRVKASKGPHFEGSTPMFTDEQRQTFYKLREWCVDGKLMPGYCYGFGRPYLCHLLGVKFPDEIHKVEPYYRLLCGPHGWTILQMLIKRRGVKDGQAITGL